MRFWNLPRARCPGKRAGLQPQAVSLLGARFCKCCPLFCLISASCQHLQRLNCGAWVHRSYMCVAMTTDQTKVLVPVKGKNSMRHGCGQPRGDFRSQAPHLQRGGEDPAPGCRQGRCCGSRWQADQIQEFSTLKYSHRITKELSTVCIQGSSQGGLSSFY